MILVKVIHGIHPTPNYEMPLEYYTIPICYFILRGVQGFKVSGTYGMPLHDLYIT